MGGSAAALIWLVLDTNMVIESRRYTDGGSWDGAVHLQVPFGGSLPDAASPKIAMNAHGVTLATWKQQGNGEEDAALNFYLPGTGWATYPEVSGIDLSLIRGGTSDPVVAIGANDYGEWVIGAYAYIHALPFEQIGGAGTGANVNDSGNLPACPWVSANARGAAMAVWTEMPASGSWLNKAWFYDPQAVQPPPPVTIGTGAPSMLGCPRVALDDLGRAVAVWTVTSGGVSSLAYRMTDTSQSWGAGAATVDTGGLAVFNPDLALSATGEGLVVWEQSTTTSASATRDVRALHFQISQGLDAAGPVGVGSTAPASGPRVVVSGAQAGVAVWLQAGRLWSNAFLAAQGGWRQAAPIDSVRSGYTSQNPDLATDRNGRALATWESTTGGIPDVMVARFE
jgi:hypothetical protein